MAYDLKGKFAVVTGGGSGICHALTEMLLEAGCSVLVVDLRLRPEAEATVSGHPHPPPAPGAPSALFHRADVTNWGQLRAAWDRALAAFGRVDVVVSGAGTFEPPSSSFWFPPGGSSSSSPGAEDDPDAELGQYRTLAVNLAAPVRLAQIAVEYWLRPENREVKGNLLWLASMGGYLHQMQTPLYFASKAGIVSMVKSLAKMKEAFGIRNSAVCPGAVWTPIFEPAYCRDRLREEDVSLSAEECAGVIMKVLQEPQYGDGSIVEVQRVGTKEDSNIVTRDVQLEALYPTNGVFEQVKAAMAAEAAMIKKLQESGM